MKLVLVTGGFDPLHKGHLEYFKAAKKLGDKLIVGVNSDEWLTRKKGRPFMPFQDRIEIIKNLEMVDGVIDIPNDYKFDDAGGAIFKLMSINPTDTKIIVANGGDRIKGNVPEMDTFNDSRNVEFVFGVGGTDKMNSSSWILDEWKAPKTERNWGYYRVLHEDGPTTKVKELTVDPGKKLSMQRHENRSEYWLVTEGIATVYTINISSDAELLGTFKKHQSLRIDEGQWHQLVNETDKPVKIVEIQYGKNCIEDDIERK